MARPIRNDIDYFPFYIKEGRTLYVLESKYGCTGTGFFTNVMRFLGRTPEHYFCIDDAGDRLWFFSKTYCDEEAGLDMLNLMAQTGKIDPELWTKYRVIVSNDFLRSIKDAYRKRKNECITLDEIRQRFGVSGGRNPHEPGFPAEETEQQSQSGDVSGAGNTQRKEKKRKKDLNKEIFVDSNTKPPDGGDFFKNALREYLDEINKAAELIHNDGFTQVHHLVQVWFNRQIHPGAICEVLKNARPYLKKADKKRAYLESVIETIGPNWRAKEFEKEHEKNKTMYDEILKSLRKGKTK